MSAHTECAGVHLLVCLYVLARVSVWSFSNLMQSGFWDIFLLNGKVVHLLHLLKDHRGRELRVNIMQSYTQRETHTHTHLFKVSLWHFLGAYGPVNVISEGHINMVAVGLFVSHGKQRVSTCCVIFCDTLYSDAHKPTLSSLHQTRENSTNRLL